MREIVMYIPAMAVPARLELATFGLGNRCSIRLSYGTNSTARAQIFFLSHVLFGKPVSAHRVKPEGMLFRDML
jgi:hypothetical protein